MQLTTSSKRLGFIGTGTITAAIVRGLCDAPDCDFAITLSPRNDVLANRLAQRYANVTVGSDNQDVVHRSDMLILAVRPDVAEAVVRALNIPPGRLLVSLVATIDLDRMRTWVGEDVRLVRALPLPFVADGKGVTMITPPDEGIMALFSACGKAVGCNSLAEFELLTTASAFMGTYFGLLERLVSWLESEGLDGATADDYLRSLMISLAEKSSASTASSFEELRTEFSTKGGLNEQIFRDFEGKGGTDALLAAMSAALARVRRGRSAGPT